MKILRYLSDDSISYSTPKNFEIHKEKENCILFNYDSKFERGNIAIKIQQIWVDFGIYNVENFNKDFSKIIEAREKQILNETADSSFYVNKQYLELIKLIDDRFYLENGTTKEERINVFMEINKNFLEEKEIQKQIEADRKERFKIEQQEKLNKEMDLLLIKFKDGEKIKWDELNNLIEFFKIKIHPRTQGFLNDHLNKSNDYFISKSSGTFLKKKSSKSIQSFFDFIKQVELF